MSKVYKRVSKLTRIPKLMISAALFSMLISFATSGDGVLAAGVQSEFDLSELRNKPESSSSIANTVVSKEINDIAITIYRDNLALITEKRRLVLPEGRATISFAGVSDRMIAQTAILQEFTGVTLERNFDFNLLSKASLLEKSVGQTVYVSRNNPATGRIIEEEAIIVSAGQGVVLNIQGRIEAFECSGLPEKIIFEDLPQGLNPQPTLSIEVNSKTAGEQEFVISYLASGFDWQADYILTLGEQGKADLAGWLTLTNGTSISIKNAPTAIVAGELQRLYETRSKAVSAAGVYASCWRKGSTKHGTPYRALGVQTPLRQRKLNERAFASAADTEGAVVSASRLSGTLALEARREDLGDYKLYTTPEPTSVAAYQTKQVAFLQKFDIDVERRHVFDFFPDQFGETQDTIINNARLRYDINNEKGGALAQPLPAGTVRVMSKVSERENEELETLFLGADDVRDLAVGLPVEVDIADSPSVTIETTVLSATEKETRNTEWIGSARLRHQVRNANPYSVEVEITENRFGGYANVKIFKASRKQMKDSPYPKWRFTVPAFGTADLSYTTNYSY